MRSPPLREQIPATTVLGMSDPKTPAPAELGPFADTTTTTFKISGPIEISVTTKRDSTHVPPSAAPCGCHGQKSGMSIDDLIAMAKMATSATPEG